MTTWLEHVARWKDCAACDLCNQRTNICLARGQVPCDVLFVGEAPGASEDALGRPFVGPAGNLLDKIIERAFHQGHDVLTDDDGGFEDSMPTQECRRCHKSGAMLVEQPCFPLATCAFTNLVACFPADAKMRGDNEPELDEIKACRPRLVEFISLAQPKLVVLVGRLASDWVGHDSYGRVGGVKAIDIVHPAFILARLPLAQKHMAVQKCIVQIRTAFEDIMEEGK